MRITPIVERLNRDAWPIWAGFFTTGLDGLAILLWAQARRGAAVAIPLLLACQGFMYWFYRHECVVRVGGIRAESEELAGLYDALLRLAMFLPAAIAMVTLSLMPGA